MPVISFPPADDTNRKALDRSRAFLYLTGYYRIIDWRPQPDLNRRRRRERAVSWAGLDDGDAFGEPRRGRTGDHLIKSQVLYQLS